MTYIGSYLPAFFFFFKLSIETVWWRPQEELLHMHYLDRSGHVSAVPSRPRETCFNSDLAVHAAITQYIGHYIQLVMCI